MKVEGAKQVHYESGPNMTPLVDVVMVILIFLMLAGSFGTSEHFLASKTPFHAKGGGGEPDPSFVPPTILDVRLVDNTGNFTLTGQNDPATGRPEIMFKPDDLRKALEKRKAQFGAADTDKVEVVLRPLESSRWESLAPLYDAALRAKYEKVSFAMTGS